MAPKNQAKPTTGNEQGQQHSGHSEDLREPQPFVEQLIVRPEHERQHGRDRQRQKDAREGGEEGADGPEQRHHRGQDDGCRGDRRRGSDGGALAFREFDLHGCSSSAGRYHLATCRLSKRRAQPLRILLRMTVTLLDRPPRTLTRSLGPYRRCDYMALPDEPRCELIRGRFYLSPSPIVLHQLIVGHLFRLFLDVADRTGGTAIVAPMDVHLADHSVVQPDVIYVSPERGEIVQDWMEGAPDLLVEVLSPSTASRDRVHKLDLYADGRRAGVLDRRSAAAPDHVPGSRR